MTGSLNKKISKFCMLNVHQRVKTLTEYKYGNAGNYELHFKKLHLRTFTSELRASPKGGGLKYRPFKICRFSLRITHPRTTLLKYCATYLVFCNKSLSLLNIINYQKSCTINKVINVFYIKHTLQ